MAITMTTKKDKKSIMHSMSPITSSLTVLLMYVDMRDYAIALCNNIREKDERFAELDKIILSLDYERYYELKPYSKYALLTLLALTHSTERKDSWFKHIVNRHQPLCLESESLLSAVIDAYTCILVLRHIEIKNGPSNNFPIILPISLVRKVTRMRILLTKEMGNPLVTKSSTAESYVRALGFAKIIDDLINAVLLESTSDISKNIERSCEEYFRKNKKERSISDCLTSNVIDFGHEPRLKSSTNIRENNLLEEML